MPINDSSGMHSGAIALYFFLFLSCDAFSLILPDSLFWVKPYLFFLCVVVAVILAVPLYFRDQRNRTAIVIGTVLFVFLLTAALRGRQEIIYYRSVEYVLFSLFIVAVSSLLAPSCDSRVTSIAWGLSLSVCFQAVVMAGTLIQASIDSAGVDNDIFLINPGEGNALIGEMYKTITRNVGYVAILMAALYRDGGRWYFLASSVVLVIVALFGGGRGELIAIIIITGIIFHKKAILMVIAAGGVALMLPGVCDVFFKAGTITRIGQLFEGQSFGDFDLSYREREMFLSQAFDMVVSSPLLFLTGSGAYGFQFAHGYSAGMYPHNVIAEAFTTGGILFGIFLIGILWVFVVRFRRAYKSECWHSTFVYGITAFVVLIALKSGGMWSNWSMFSLLVISCSMFQDPPIFGFITTNKRLMDLVASIWRRS